MRLIDADALIMALRLEYPMMPMFKESQKEWEIKTEGYRKAEEVIKDAPTIDIVRCKECKHASDNKVYGCLCNHFNDNDWAYHRMYADDFCSYGVKKGADDETD